jgi:hypothetical protein
MRGELPPADEITRAAADELSQPKYRLGSPWWSRLVDFLERAWVRFVEWVTAISDAVGGPLVMALLVGAVLVVITALITTNLGRRRARRVEARIRREHERVRGLDPSELERRAEEAERRGDLADAFHLLFQAALIHLDRAGAIDLTPGTTTGLLAETLGSPEFRHLAGRFDAVVYGDKPALSADVAAARRLPATVLATSDRSR